MFGPCWYDWAVKYFERVKPFIKSLNVMSQCYIFWSRSFKCNSLFQIIIKGVFINVYYITSWFYLNIYGYGYFIPIHAHLSVSTFWLKYVPIAKWRFEVHNSFSFSLYIVILKILTQMWVFILWVGVYQLICIVLKKELISFYENFIS